LNLNLGWHFRHVTVGGCAAYGSPGKPPDQDAERRLGMGIHRQMLGELRHFDEVTVAGMQASRVTPTPVLGRSSP